MNKIEFLAPKEYYDLKEDFPTPIKTNIPEWYKKLEHGQIDKDTLVHQRTIKGCMPFLESMITGYLLKLHVDYKIEYGVKKDDQGKPITRIFTSIDEGGATNIMKARGVNIADPKTHTSGQLEGSPFIDKNGGKDRPFLKIHNPWRIKTPRGYSCLFVNPLNNPSQDFFSIIPAIVHTDTYHFQEINFPIIMNYQKHGEVDLTLQKGLPYVQVIPFKREDWKMKTTFYESTQEKLQPSFWGIQFLNRYKNMFYLKNKSSWK